MKKKIFLLISAMIMLCCLFAICASAKTVIYDGQEIELIDNLGDPTWYTGNTSLAIQDKESIVILKDSEGNMKAYPAYYILKFNVSVENGAVKYAHITWADKGGVTYDWLNEKLGTSYQSGSIYYIEFPYGITLCHNNSIFGKDAEAKPESNVVEIKLPASVTSIDTQAFRRMNNCKKINIPAGVKTLADWTFCGSAKLETVVFDEGSQIEQISKAFASCTSLKNINLQDCNNLKTIGASAFNSCTSLNEIALPDSLETIGNQAFYKIGELKIAGDYLPKNLKNIGTHFLSGCTIVNEVLYFPEGMTEFSKSYHFNDGCAVKTQLTLVFLGKMTDVNISNTALVTFTSTGDKKPLTIVLAQNTYSELGGDFLQGTSLNGVDGYIVKNADGSVPYTTKEGTLTVRLCNNDPNSGTNLGKDANGNTVFKAEGAPATVIFCGSEKVELCYSVRNSNTDKGWYRFFTTPFEYDMAGHTVHYDNVVVESLVNCGFDGVTTNTCVLCQRVASVVVPATNDHKYEVDNDCTTSHSCKVCEKVIIEAMEHILSKDIQYASGFTAVGAYIEKCTNEGCFHKVTEETPAIFTCRGYSVDESGKGGMVLRYLLCGEAIERYETVTGKVFNYGVFAVSQKLLGNDDIMSSDSAIKVNLSNQKFDIFELKLLGFNTDETKSAMIAIGAYVSITDGEAVEYSYIQTGEASENEKYYFTSFNEILKQTIK